MEEEYIQFEDESGDKKYFAIVPYLITNGYDAKTIGVYTYIKRKCGENPNGIWFENKDKVSEKLRMDLSTLLKILNRLEKDKRIEYLGKKVLKTRPTKVYRICNIWKENILTIEKDKEIPRKTEVSFQKDTPSNQDKIPRQTISKNKPLKNNFTKVSKPRRDLQIISLFIREIGLKPDNKDQFNQIVRRNLRAAKNLIGYLDEDIKATIQVLKNTDYLKRFTLETVGKYIDEVVAQKTKQGPKIVKFVEVKDKEGNIKMRAIYED